MRGKGKVFVAMAALFWGLSGGIGGILIGNGWDVFVVSFYRGAIGLLFVLIWLMLHPDGNGFTSLKLWLWSVVAGLGVAGNFAFYFISIEQGSVAVAAALMYSAPVFVYLVSFTLKLERPSVLKLAAVVAVIVGIVLLTQIYDIGLSDITPLGVATGIFAGLSYAVFIFGFKFASPHGSPQAILSIAFAVLVLILFWPGEDNQITAVLSSQDWPLFAALGLLGAGLSFFFYVVGLNRIAPGVASIEAMVEPVTATLFGILILNESLAGTQFLGMGLILSAVTALGIYSNARQEPSE